MERLLLEHWWLGAALWAVSYTTDYYLTVWGAVLRARCDPASDGRHSYELTPQYRADIDARRLVSRRFLVALGTGVGLILLYAQIARLVAWLPLYLLTIGLLLLVEVPIIIRHVRNIALFRYALAHGGWKNPDVTLGAMLWASGAELLAFAAVFFLAAAVTGSWLALGGAVRCLLVGLQHCAMSRAERAKDAGRAAERAAA